MSSAYKDGIMLQMDGYGENITGYERADLKSDSFFHLKWWFYIEYRSKMTGVTECFTAWMSGTGYSMTPTPICIIGPSLIFSCMTLLVLHT